MFVCLWKSCFFFKLFPSSLLHDPPFPWLERAKVEVADLNADEPQGGETDGGGDMAHLAVLALGEG